MTGPRVVVLGATGYIGSTLVARLGAAGVPVRAVARRPTRFDPPVRAVCADACDPATLAGLVEDADVVVHLVARLDTDRGWRVAAEDPSGHNVNVAPILDLIDVLDGLAQRRAPDRRPPLVLVAGTTGQVGCPDRVRIDGSEPDHPVTPYDQHKLTVERALLDATEAGVLRAVPLRLPTIYGLAAASRSAGNGVVAAMVRRALAGQDLTMWHDGSVVRDLLHVSDTAAAFAAAIEHASQHDDLVGRPWLLGTGHGVPLGEVFAAIASITAEQTGQPPVAVRSVPPPPHAAPTDLHGVEVDSSAFRAITGWRPHTTLDAGLRALVRQLHEH